MFGRKKARSPDEALLAARGAAINLDLGRPDWLRLCAEELGCVYEDNPSLLKYVRGFELSGVRRVVGRKRYVRDAERFVEDACGYWYEGEDASEVLTLSRSFPGVSKEDVESFVGFAAGLAERLLGRKPSAGEVASALTRCIVMGFVPEFTVAMAFDDVREMGKLAQEMDRRGFTRG